jgi:glycosyltransferase involved in cell wall biosynthesis
LRILQIIASLDLTGGGPPDAANRLGQIWAAQDHEVCVVTLDHPDAAYLRGLPYQAIGLGQLGKPGGTDLSKLWVRFGYSPLLVPWLRANAANYDIVLVHALWNYSTTAARIALTGSGVRHFVFPHGSLSPWFKQVYPIKSLIKKLIWKVNEGRLVNGATAVLFTTRTERDEARLAFSPYRANAEVAGFGSAEPPSDLARQIEAFHSTVPQVDGRRFILFVGRLHTVKGCDLLIRAFAKVASGNPDLDLVMMGPDPDGLLEHLKALSAELGIADRVFFPGMIDGAAKWGAYRTGEVFALTSHTENFGVVVAEALSCGLPVLITDKVNIWQEVAGDGAGLVESDTQDGADRLLTRYFGMSDDQTTAMRAAARACYERHFRIESTAQRIIELGEKYGAVQGGADLAGDKDQAFG